MVQTCLAREESIEHLLQAGHEATANFGASILPILVQRLAQPKNAVEKRELVESVCSLFEKAPHLAVGDAKTFSHLVDCLKDPSAQVRKVVLQFLKGFVLRGETVKDLYESTDLVPSLHERISDKDVECRCEGIEALCSLYCSSGVGLVDKRAIEKMSFFASSQQKPPLQEIAHTALCRILQVYLDQMVAGDEEALEQLQLLPSAAFLSYKVKSFPYRAVVDLNIEKYVWSSSRARADSWVALHSLMNPVARLTLQEMLKEKHELRLRLRAVLDQREGVKGFVSDEQRATFQESIEQLLALGFEDTARSRPFFENLKDKTVLKKLGELCDPESHEQAREAGGQLLRHLAGSPAEEVETLVKRLSTNVLTMEDMSGLIDLLHSPQQRDVAELLVSIAGGDKSLFRPDYVSAMVDRLREKPEDEVAVPLLKAILKTDKTVLNDDNRLCRCLEAFCTTGSRKTAKWATRAIAATEGGHEILAALVRKMTAKQITGSHRHLIPLLACLTEVYRTHFEVAASRSEEFIKLVIQNVILGEAPLAAKTEALRLSGWFLAMVPFGEGECAATASGVARLLGSVMQQRGQVVPSNDEEYCRDLCVAAAKATVRSAMNASPNKGRYCLASSLTHLGSVLTGDDKLSEAVLPKIQFGLLKGVLPPKFMALLALVALPATKQHEKQLENDLAKACEYQDRRVAMFNQSRPGNEEANKAHTPEAQLPALLYLLATVRFEPDLHHPDNLRLLQRPIEVFLKRVLGANLERAPYLAAVINMLQGVDVKGEGGRESRGFEVVVAAAGSVLDNLLPASQSRQRYPGKINLSSILFTMKPKRKQPDTPLERSQTQNKSKKATPSSGRLFPDSAVAKTSKRMDVDNEPETPFDFARSTREKEDDDRWMDEEDDASPQEVTSAKPKKAVSKKPTAKKAAAKKPKAAAKKKAR